MKLYITTEKITEPLGAGRHQTIFEKGEIVQLIYDGGPFPQVRRPGDKGKPKAVSWKKLKEYNQK